MEGLDLGGRPSLPMVTGGGGALPPRHSRGRTHVDEGRVDVVRVLLAPLHGQDHAVEVICRRQVLW